jgi:hypothetical protein
VSPSSEVIISQKVKKFTSFCGNRSFCTVFKTSPQAPIGTHPTPLESSPHTHTVFLGDAFQYHQYSCVRKYIPSAVFDSVLAPTPLYAFSVCSTVSYLCNFTPEHSVARSTKPDHVPFLCSPTTYRHSDHHWDWIKSVTLFCVLPIGGLIKQFYCV